MSEAREQRKAQRFQRLLEAFEPRRPQRGSIVMGKVLQKDDDAFLMDIGAALDAIVPRKELAKLDDKELENIQVGDRFPVYVLRTARFGGDLLVSIERGIEQKDWERASKYLESGQILKLEATGENRGGLLVRFGRLNGFVPNSHLPGLRGRSRYEKRELKRSLIGSILALKVLEVSPNRHKLILSAREARKIEGEERLRNLQIGQTVRGRVVNLVDFGAFVDLGGVDGLIHISELTHREDVNRASEVLEVGDRVEVVVTSIDIDRERVGLSRKALLEDPWETAANKYEVGDLVEGEIAKVNDFGTLVRLPDGLEGLIHQDEIRPDSFDQRSAPAREGQRVVARILNIEPEQQQMTLGLRDITYADDQAGKDAMAEQDELEPEERK